MAIRLSTQSYDSDTSWYAQMAAAASPLLAWFNQNVVNGPTMNPDSMRDVTIGATGVQTLLFGAPSSMGNNDYFKIWTIDATAARTTLSRVRWLCSGVVWLAWVSRAQAQPQVTAFLRSGEFGPALGGVGSIFLWRIFVAALGAMLEITVATYCFGRCHVCPAFGRRNQTRCSRDGCL